MDIVQAAITFLIILDPLGNLPIFASILRHIEPARRRRVLLRELVVALVIMLLFLYSGDSLLQFLNLRQEAVSIAGGIVLFVIAMRMIFPQPGGVTGIAAGEEPFIVPMAVPLMAGPSILASLILIANQAPERMLDWTLALVLAWLVSAAVLMFYSQFHRVLGDRGLKAVERLMGMILIMIAVQMFLDGLAQYLHLNS